MNDTNWQNLPNTTTPILAEKLNKLDRAIINNENVDLNDFTTDGEYYFPYTTTKTNMPSGVANGWLKVMSGSDNNGTTTKQLFYRHGTANNNDFQMYVRTFAGGTWSNWKRYVTYEEVFDLTEGHGTRNTNNTNATDFMCDWRKIGRICYVSCYINPSTTNSNATLVTGLPPAKDYQDFNLAGNGKISANFRVTSGGTINTFYLNNGNNNITYKGGFSYITAN